MALFEQKVLDFWQSICDNTCPQNKLEAFAKDLGEAVTEKALANLSRPNDEPFRLRMSAMGKALRQLLLQKKHGREKVSPALLQRFTYGHLYEALFFTVLKHSGVDFTPNVKVELPVGNGEVITGELDLVFNIDGRIWDVKTASPYAMAKFENWETLQANDSFGYFAQLFGYAEATGIPAGGWVAIDKSSGLWKIVEIPQSEHQRLRKQYVKEIVAKADHIINRPDDIPPCPGVEEETFNGKKTGNKILGKVCQYCPYKNGICHKKVTKEPCRYSKAKTKTYKYYVGD